VKPRTARRGDEVSAAAGVVFTTMDVLPAEPPSLLAAQARSVTRRLATALGDAALGPPGELFRVVSALRLLADDVAQLLPAVQHQLEDGLLAGQVEPLGGDVEAAVEAVTAVGYALTNARTAELAANRELQSAEIVLRRLSAPNP
jgi:hypothetical protein